MGNGNGTKGPELGRKGANNGYTPMFFFFSEILTVIDGGNRLEYAQKWIIRSAGLVDREISEGRKGEEDGREGICRMNEKIAQFKC